MEHHDAPSRNSHPDDLNQEPNLGTQIRRGQKARGAARLGGSLPRWRNFCDAEAERYPALLWITRKSLLMPAYAQ
jgi:hypothetical protein